MFNDIFDGIFLGGIMMSYAEEYQKKLTTAEEAVKVVKKLYL